VRRPGVALVLALATARLALAQELPPCRNAVLQRVVRRVGCTLGDERCWVRAGGFCTDYVEQRILARAAGRTMELVSVEAADVRAGDVAVFFEAPHYAWIERVEKDATGRPVAVDVSEYNFGTCWIDDELMVTDRFKVLGRRRGIALAAVDGGFRRPTPVLR
jgi:hypothetical protein